MTHYHLSLDPRESQAMYAARFRRTRAVRRALWLALAAAVAALVIVLAGALPAGAAVDHPGRAVWVCKYKLRAIDPPRHVLVCKRVAK